MVFFVFSVVQRTPKVLMFQSDGLPEEFKLFMDNDIDLDLCHILLPVHLLFFLIVIHVCIFIAWCTAFARVSKSLQMIIINHFFSLTWYGVKRGSFLVKLEPTKKSNLVVRIYWKSWEQETKTERKKVENVLSPLEEVDSWPALLKPLFKLNYEQKYTTVQLGQVSLESYLNHLDQRKLLDTTQKLSLSPSRTRGVTMATFTSPFQYSMSGSYQLKHTIPWWTQRWENKTQWIRQKR